MWTRSTNTIRVPSKKITDPEGRGPGEDLIAQSGITFHLWRLYQHFWLVCLLFPLMALVREPLVPWRLALGIFALLFFATSYTWIMWPHPVHQRTHVRTRSRLSFLLFVALSLQVTVFSFADTLAWLWLFLGVSAMAGVLLPIRSAFAAIVLFTLLPLAITIKTHGGIEGIDWWWLIALMLLVRGLGLDMIGVARLGNAIRELSTARRELAHMAVIEERLRLSRDLHDLLGQSLSVMTLKSELARGLVQQEPEQCAQELAEIEQVARQLLREVRKTVAGYRQPTLANELEGAQHLLEAAGIDVVVERTTGDLPVALDAALAWTVREGVTNVIHHSHAHHCTITLKEVGRRICAEVLNDGSAPEPGEGIPERAGLGLAGLRERVTALGGDMEAGPLAISSKEGFLLHVELPMQREIDAPAWQGV
jgi:two-component system sensor histidine kinase DesK